MRRSPALWLAALMIASSFGAVTGPTPDLDRAQLALRDGHSAQAAQHLQRLVAQEPRNALAWRSLGMADMNLQRFGEGIAALQTSLTLDAQAPRTLYQLGVAHALAGDLEAAFKWFGATRASGRFDMTEIAGDARLAAVRADARYASLLPRAEDFEPPFVEPTKIIREWRAEAADDQFGWIARPVGDVDGDGIVDIVTSAPTHGAHGSHAGRIYLYSVGSGKLLWTADGEPGDELGSGVEGIGDTDGDGIADVIASGPAGQGIAHIYSGVDGHVLQTFHSPRSDEQFGNHIAGIGDVDADGFADLIVGSPGKDDEHSTPGHAYVYSGHSGRLIATLTGERKGDQFGSSVAGRTIGRRSWLVVGAPGAGPTHHGRAYVYDGTTMTLKFTIDADATGAALGAMFVAVIPGVNGYGQPSIYVSDWSNNAQGLSSGRVYLYAAGTGKRLWTLSGESRGDGFGTSPAVAGDIDGDGYADLIVGAWQYGGAAVSGGRAYLYSGRTHELLRTYTCRVPGDTFGFDAVGLGDVDGDGVDDLLITSGWSAVSGHHSGRVFVISSGIPRRERRVHGA
jgi:hypothetical protein